MEKQTSTKRVWILGSGFSRPLGGPLLNDLLTAYPPSNQHTDPGLGHVTQDLYNADRRVRTNFHRWREKRWPHAEAFLNLVETARDETGGHTAAKGLIDLEGFQNVVGISDAARRALLLDCWSFLDIDHDKIISYEQWAPFVDWAQALTNDDSIITFNYDTVPDLLASHAGGFLRIIRPNHVREDLVTNNHRSAAVFKLHGSVNWAVKQVGQSTTYSLASGNDSPTFGDRGLTPLMGFPGPNKMSTCHTLLNDLWDNAVQRLKDAEEIIFIGYAFPETDNYARRTLLSCLRDNLKASVTLVLGAQNPDTARVASMLERFSGLGMFRNANCSGQQFLTEYQLLGGNPILANEKRRAPKVDIKNGP